MLLTEFEELVRTLKCVQNVQGMIWIGITNLPDPNLTTIVTIGMDGEEDADKIGTGNDLVSAWADFKEKNTFLYRKGFWYQ